MDVFTLNTEYKADVNVSGIKKSIWVERYNRHGYFRFVGDPLKLRQSLPEGTLISHTKTNTIMMVETHIIEEESKKTAEVVISGRTIDAIAMENRVITSNDVTWVEEDIGWLTQNTSVDPMVYTLPDTNGWYQVISLLKQYFIENDFAEENIPNLFIPSGEILGVNEVHHTPKQIKTPSYLSTAVYRILQSCDCGIKVERPSSERIVAALDFEPNETFYFRVYLGDDLSGSVSFDWGAGDLKSSRYLWSNKHTKNGFYSFGKGATIRYSESNSGLFSRMAAVDAMDLNLDPDLEPSDIYPYVSSRGFEEINQPDESIIVDAVVSTSAGPKFNKDYKLGDIVTVLGNYGTVGKLRVIEHAITSDNKGDKSIPTLAPFGPFGFGSG